MVFVDYQPVRRVLQKSQGGTGIKCSLRKYRDDDVPTMRVSFSKRISEKLFDNPVLPVGLNIQFGEGDDFGKMRLTQNSFAKGVASTRIFGSGNTKHHRLDLGLVELFGTDEQEAECVDWFHVDHVIEITLPDWVMRQGELRKREPATQAFKSLNITMDDTAAGQISQSGSQSKNKPAADKRVLPVRLKEYLGDLSLEQGGRRLVLEISVVAEALGEIPKGIKSAIGTLQRQNAILVFPANDPNQLLVEVLD